MERLLDLVEAAKVLAVSPWTVRAYIRQGKMSPVHIGRLVRLEPSEIQRFIEAAKVNVREAQKSNKGGAAQ